MAYFRLLLALLAFIISPLSAQVIPASQLVDADGVPYVETLREIRKACQDTSVTANGCITTVNIAYVVLNTKWKSLLSSCILTPLQTRDIATPSLECKKQFQELVDTNITSLATGTKEPVPLSLLQEITRQ